MTPTVDNKETTKPRPQWRDPALVAGLTLLVYLFTLSFGFIYDDLSQIVGNPQLRSWSYAPVYFQQSVWAFAGNTQNAYYRPMMMLWMRCCYALFGLQPLGWHLAMALCHAAAAALGLRWLRAIGVGRTAALLAALIFALHPAHVESVAWCSAAPDPLLAIFIFTALLLNLRAMRQHSMYAHAGAALACAAALLCKETGVFLPLLLTLQTAIFGESEGWRARLLQTLRCNWIYWLEIVGYLLVRACVLKGIAHAAGHFPPSMILYTLPQMAFFYVRQLICPISVTAFYDMSYLSEPTAAFWLPLIALLAILAALFYALRCMADRRRTYMALAILLFLVPPLYFPGYHYGELVHDRYLYLPLAGFVLLLAELAALVSKRWPAARPRMKLLAVLAIFAFACQSMVIEQHYRSDLSYFAWSVENAPNNIQACSGYAHALHASGHEPESMMVREHILRLDPMEANTLQSLGVQYCKAGRAKEAADLLSRALQVRETDETAHLYLGMILLDHNASDAAAAHIQRALEINPQMLEAHMALGLARESQGRLAEAAALYKQELAIQPGNALVEAQLAKVEKEIAEKK